MSQIDILSGNVTWRTARPSATLKTNMLPPRYPAKAITVLSGENAGETNVLMGALKEAAFLLLEACHISILLSGLSLLLPPELIDPATAIKC